MTLISFKWFSPTWAPLQASCSPIPGIWIWSIALLAHPEQVCNQQQFFNTLSQYSKYLFLATWRTTSTRVQNVPGFYWEYANVQPSDNKILNVPAQGLRLEQLPACCIWGRVGGCTLLELTDAEYYAINASGQDLHCCSNPV